MAEEVERDDFLARFGAADLVLCSAALSVAQAQAANRINAEYPIAGANVGYDECNHPMQRVTTVALFAGDDERDLEKPTQRCLDFRLADVTKLVRRQAHDGAPGSQWRPTTTVLTDPALKAERCGRTATFLDFQIARAARAEEMQGAMLRGVHKLQDAQERDDALTQYVSADTLVHLSSDMKAVPDVEQCQAEAPLLWWA